MAAERAESPKAAAYRRAVEALGEAIELSGSRRERANTAALFASQAATLCALVAGEAG